ncbi:MAG: RNA polymerase sigma factor [Desertimonas sp.]
MGRMPRHELDDQQRQLDVAWRTHGPAAMRFATVLAGPADAPDIATTAFLRVTARPGWTSIEHLDRYLLRAVRNEARSLARSRQRRWRRDLAAVTADETTMTPRDLDVLRAVASLSSQQRSVVFLAYWQDMTEADIATTLDLSRGSVHRTLARARTVLRKALT